MSYIPRFSASIKCRVSLICGPLAKFEDAPDSSSGSARSPGSSPGWATKNSQRNEKIMQTFLPYADFSKTASCLDNKRLGKQRVESMQILNILLDTTSTVGWRNHPAVLMWKGHEGVLFEYLETICNEWKSRGYNNTKLEIYVNETKSKFSNFLDSHKKIPSWLGLDKFHDSHKSNLLRKDKSYYSVNQWNVPDDLEYIWPSKT